MKITPVLVVEEIEKSLPFWIDRFGFENVVSVPDGEKLGFAILQREGVEVMMQTAESIRKDVPQFAVEGAPSRTSLFLEVADLAEVEKQLAGYPIAMEERKTFYGMREIGVFEPSGHIIIFASPTEAA